MLRTDFDHASTPSRLAQMLEQHFACHDPELVALIEARAQYVTLAPGETLFAEGDDGADIWFVLSGRLRATAGTRLLGEIGRGETIGELALFTGEPRSATVTALRQSQLARFSRALVERLIASRPQVALGLTRLVIDRYRRREQGRQPASVPVTLAILPVTPGVDAVGFARALRARQPADFGQVALLAHDQFGAISRNTGPAWEHDVARYLDEVERANAAVYLVADPGNDAWTRFCLEHADEVLLLADATQSPVPGATETRLLAPEAPITIARQTLVLLHPAGTRSPRHTSHWLALRHCDRHVHLRRDHEPDLSRLARVVSGRATGLVLAGGGARGFAHIGVYQALEAAGVPVDFVGGTSIGALMGTLIALDLSAAEMRETARQAFLGRRAGTITGDYNLLPLVSLINGGRSRAALGAAIRRHTGGPIDMEDTWKPLFAMASNFSSGSEEVLASGPLEASIAASYAIPGALPPVVRDGQLLFDGAIFNNLPIGVMADRGVSRIIAVELAGEGLDRLATDTLPGPLALLRDRLTPAARQRWRQLPTLPETMMMSAFMTSSARQRDESRHADLLFRPRLPQTGMLDWRHFDSLVAAGHAEALAVLATTS